MNFYPTEEQKAVVRLAQDFAKKEIAPYVEEAEAKGEFNKDLIRRIGEVGLYGLGFPEKYGGSNLGFVAQSMVIEEMSRAWIAAGLSFNAQAMVVPAGIYYWGTEKHRQEYLPKLFQGEIIGCISLTEPDVGSDSANLKCRAEKRGDSYVLNGTKSWATYGLVADLGLVMARTGPEPGARGVSAFLVPFNEVTGVKRTKIQCSIGTKCVPTTEIVFENCSIPATSLIAEEGKGLIVALGSLNFGRITVPSRCLGTIQASLDAILRYANERVAFGRPIGRFQMIQHLVADVVTNLEAARLLVRQAAFLADQGEPFTREAAIAKYFTAHVAKQAADAAMEVHGAYGLSDEFPVHRYQEFANMMHTGEGPANIQRILIAEDSLGYKNANRHSLPKPV